MWTPFSFFGVWFLIFLECGKVFVVVFLLSLWFSFIFSVTLPGTNAPHSAVTRGKPSLFVFLASRAL